MKLKKLFSKRGIVAGTTDQEEDDKGVESMDLMNAPSTRKSTRAMFSALQQSHQDWGDWSVEDSQSSDRVGDSQSSNQVYDSDEFVPLNDTPSPVKPQFAPRDMFATFTSRSERGARTVKLPLTPVETSRSEHRRTVGLSPIARSASLSQLKKSKTGDSGESERRRRKKKKIPKEKDPEAGEKPSKITKTKKKRSKSEPVKDLATLRAEAQVKKSKGDSSPRSLKKGKATADDSSVRIVDTGKASVDEDAVSTENSKIKSPTGRKKKKNDSVSEKKKDKGKERERRERKKSKGDEASTRSVRSAATSASEQDSLMSFDTHSKASTPRKKKSKKAKRASKKGADDLQLSPLSNTSNESPKRRQDKSKLDNQIMGSIDPIPEVEPGPGMPELPRQEEKKDTVDAQESSSNIMLGSSSSEGLQLDKGVGLTDLQDMPGHTSASSLSLPGQEDIQRTEVLRLQNQLSEALQKIVLTTEEQIQDKDQCLRVSTELAKLKEGMEAAEKEKKELCKQLEEREAVVESSMQRIDKLEEAIERQLDEQDALEIKLERSEDEIEKLLVEIQDLEAGTAEGDDGDHTALRTQLKEAKKDLIDKQREIDDYKSRAEYLENEMTENARVSKMLVDEMEEENKALQGRLKGERLDLTSKMAKKDEAIANLQKELSKFQHDSDAQDLASALEELKKSQEEAETSKNDMDAAQQVAAKLKSEKEDLLERNNSLNEKVRVLQKNVTDLTEKSKELGEKVLQWTERTYEWKNRAESAEKRVEAYADRSDDDMGSEPDEVVDEAPQGLFLQAVMDRRENQTKKPKWRIFGNANSVDGEDPTPEEIRIKNLEERNNSLEESIAQLRSEIVKMQSTHKEEAYSTQKKIVQLQGENDALIVRNTTLEQICGSANGEDA